MIRAVQASDFGAIAAIYNHFIQHTLVTFEEAILSADEFGLRINEVLNAGLPWFVAEEDGKLLGYAYASKWKGRCAYRYSVEVTVYLSPQATAKGWGSRLYSQLFEMLRQQSVHVALAGIALPNAASIALHEKFGMEKTAHFKEVGFKKGQWIDVGYWQLILDK